MIEVRVSPCCATANCQLYRNYTPVCRMVLTAYSLFLMCLGKMAMLDPCDYANYRFASEKTPAFLLTHLSAMTPLISSSPLALGPLPQSASTLRTMSAHR